MLSISTLILTYYPNLLTPVTIAAVLTAAFSTIEKTNALAYFVATKKKKSLITFVTGVSKWIKRQKLFISLHLFGQTGSR
jgi:hypothetical protein